MEKMVVRNDDGGHPRLHSGSIDDLYLLAATSKNVDHQICRDVSLSMLAIFTSGVALWLAYGIIMHAWSIIVTNVVMLMLTGAILGLKLRYLS